MIDAKYVVVISTATLIYANAVFFFCDDDDDDDVFFLGDVCGLFDFIKTFSLIKVII